MHPVGPEDGLLSTLYMRRGTSAEGTEGALLSEMRAVWQPVVPAFKTWASDSPPLKRQPCRCTL
jgi:hypothetical protein